MRRIGQWLRANAAFLVLLVALAGGFLYLKQDSSVASASELDAVLHDGQPTVLEFFSNT